MGQKHLLKYFILFTVIFGLQSTSNHNCCFHFIQAEAKLAITNSTSKIPLLSLSLELVKVQLKCDKTVETPEVFLRMEALVTPLVCLCFVLRF